MTQDKRSIRKQTLYIMMILLLGFGVRYLGTNFVSRDMTSFLIPWFNQIKEMSFREMLSTQVGNYGTLYQFLIFVMTKLPGEPIQLYKEISILFDVLLAMAVYCWLDILKGERAALIGMGLTFLLPTVWLNSAFWGQCDCMYVSIILWSLYFLYQKRYVPSYLLLGLAFAFKLQTVFIFPFVGYLVLRRIREKDYLHLLYLLLIPAINLVLIIPNLLAGRSLSSILSIYMNQTAENASRLYLNYPSVWGFLPENSPSMNTPAIIVTFILLILFLLYLGRNRERLDPSCFLWCAVIFSYTCVLFLPHMHERYGYLYELLLLILVIYEGCGYVQLFFLEAITLKTYIYYFDYTTYNMNLLTAINIAIYVSLLIAFVRKIHGKCYRVELFDRKQKLSPADTASGSAAEKFPLKGVLLLTALFFLIGVFRLGSLSAPETGLYLATDSESGSEIYLEFDQSVSFEKIVIFNGETSDGSLNAFAAKDTSWETIAADQKLDAVFKWIEIPFEAYTWNIALTLENASIREIICLDSEGNVILPTNASDYPELFDEQDCYDTFTTYMNETMFDEVYHARTAYEFLHGLSIYENTHPPLGKTLISIGIAIFGMTPFGWRIIPLIFGTMMIPLIALFAYEITKKQNLTLLAAFLLGTEFMHYTLSRIGTIDILVAFFVLAMFYGMYLFVKTGQKRGLVISGIASALGVATKWTAIYALAGIGLLWLIWFIREILKRKGDDKQATIRYFASVILPCIGLFILLPACVYVLSYIPFARVYTDKGLIAHAIENSQSMLSYHSNVTESHPYMSSWYSWLIDWRPLLDSYDSNGSTVSTIATFINPLTCLLGLVCVIHQAYLFLKKKDRSAEALLIMYLAMLVPWMVITRTVFIYQYFICTQILILMICYSIYRMNFVKERRIIQIVGGISLALFVLYFPVISGLGTSWTYINEILQYMPMWTL